MESGIILFTDKEKFYESLEKHTKEGVFNFLIDPTKKIKYETVETSVKSGILNKDNFKIFYSIQNKKILNNYLHQLITYNLQHKKELSAIQYIIYIYYNVHMGDPNHIYNEYHEIIKDLKISIVLLIDKK